MTGFITLSCRCGHVDDLDNFCKTPINGDLPNGCFQCPACGYAWRRRESEYRVLRAGDEAIFIPGKVELIPMEAWL